MKPYTSAKIWLSILFSFVITQASYAEQLFKSHISGTNMDKRGIALVDTITTEPRLLEIDTDGKVIWSWSVPDGMVEGRSICMGADVKYLANTDSFLLTIPNFGVLAVQRDGSYQVLLKDEKISHDIHQFKDGSILYARGFAEKKDHNFAIRNNAGQKVWSWTASEHIRSREEYWTSTCKIRERSWKRLGDADWAHANGLEVLKNGNFLLSLRNLSAFFEVDMSGQIINEYRGHVGVHEPKIFDGGFILSDRNCTGDSKSNAKERQALKILDSKGKVVKTIFEGKVNMVRGIEVLPTNNLFITTASSLMEIDQNGKIIYKAVLEGVSPDLEAQGRRQIQKKILGFCKPKTVYKAVRTK